MNLAGKKYVGKPIKKPIKAGMEGTGTAGELKFGDDQVTFILPGSDEKNAGSYKATKDEVTVKDLAGKTHTFTVKDDGKVLQNGSDEFRRTDYPW